MGNFANFMNFSVSFGQVHVVPIRYISVITCLRVSNMQLLPKHYMLLAKGLQGTEIICISVMQNHTRDAHMHHPEG